MAGPIHQHLEKHRTLRYSETWTTLKRYLLAKVINIILSNVYYCVGVHQQYTANGKNITQRIEQTCYSLALWRCMELHQIVFTPASQIAESLLRNMATTCQICSNDSEAKQARIALVFTVSVVSWRVRSNWITVNYFPLFVVNLHFFTQQIFFFMIFFQTCIDL